MENAIMERLADAVRETAGEGFEVLCKEIQKNNGVLFHAAIILEPNSEVTPAVYVDQLISEIAGKKISVAGAAEIVFQTYKEMKLDGTSMDIHRIMDKEYVLSHVEYQVVNRERNQEKVKDAPHKDLLDLSVFYRVVGSLDWDWTVSYLIDNRMIEHIGISFEELDRAAARNTENVGFIVETMGKFMAEITGEKAWLQDGEDSDSPLFILTNRRKINGANIILYSSVLSQLADRVNDDLFLLPSSIHEILAVPVSQASLEELAAMVTDVNNREVVREEILGYQVYRYSRDTGKLNIA